MCGSSATAERGVFSARVRANDAICTDHYRMVMTVDGFPATAPGQFVQIRCGSDEEAIAPRVLTWRDGELPALSQPEFLGERALLRRPFSIAGRRGDGASEIEIIHCRKGPGTQWLSEARPGVSLSILGPLGNCFSIRPDRSHAVVVGGGVGLPPMLYLAGALREAGQTTTAFVGARSGETVPLALSSDSPPTTDGTPSLCAAELAVPTVIATDDGSLGFAGVVTEALDGWLETGGVDPADLTIYACGPEPMMQAVAYVALSAGAACEVSLERYMGCGIGTCQSCVCKLRAETDQGWAYKLCCTDGPVFNAADVIWD